MADRGRPKIEIDWDQFDKLCGLQVTLNEMALWFECSPDTIENKVKQTHSMIFSEYWAQKAQKGKISLRRKMWEMALTGDRTMLIWLSKQHLNFSEKTETKNETHVSIADKISDEELVRKVEEKLEQTKLRKKEQITSQ